MLVVLTTLWLCYILGFVSFVTCQPTSSQSNNNNNNNNSNKNSNNNNNNNDELNTQIDPALYAKALTHAKTMILPLDNTNDQSLLQQVQSGSISALYTIAQSLNRRNTGDDRITSVQLWHALADGPAHHVPSAVALGFSYAQVDKYLALRYFIQAGEGTTTTTTTTTTKNNNNNNNNAGGEEEGGPHQAALYNAGRLFLELNDPTSSLAYIRACATVPLHHPSSRYATPELTNTCTEAYNILSSQIISEVSDPSSPMSDLSMEDAAEMFLYSSLEEFPLKESKEFGVWRRAMEGLEGYFGVAAAAGGASASGHGNGNTAVAGAGAGGKDGKEYLLLAQKELETLQSNYRGKMSELQEYLVETLLGRVHFLVTSMEVGDDEL